MYLLGEMVEPFDATIQIVNTLGNWVDYLSILTEDDVQHAERIVDDPQYRIIKKNKEDFTLLDVYHRSAWAYGMSHEWKGAPPVPMAYKSSIMRILRQRLGIGEDDPSKDAQIRDMGNDEALKHVLEWEGIIGYEYKIRDWIKDIYGVELRID